MRRPTSCVKVHVIIAWLILCCLQEDLASIAAKLRAYRPSATVLEAEVAPARRGEGAGCLAGPGMTASQGPADFVEVMRVKRGAHDRAIKASLTSEVYCLGACTNTACFAAIPFIFAL